jgi:amino acid transporter
MTTDSATGRVTYGNVYTQLLEYIVSADLLFYLLLVAAVILLRKRSPAAERPYRTWGYPITPVLFILAVILLIGNALIEDLNHGLRDNFSYYRALFTGGKLPYDSSGALLVFTIVLAGIPAYFLWKAAHSKRS